jgi:putative Mn2+ efflux pump MntP
VDTVSLFELLITGLALSMDAFAVTIANVCGVANGAGANAATNTSDAGRRLLVVPVVFGLFQGLMPLVGYFAGSFAATLIDRYAGIIALVILAFIGGKMVWDGAHNLKDAKGSRTGEQSGSVAGDGGRDAMGEAGDGLCASAPSAATLTLPALLAQGVATSIDALIVGVSFLALGVNIWVASSIIAATTFVCCLLALAIGKRFGVLLGDKAQIAGGAVLIFIGLKACFF